VIPGTTSICLAINTGSSASGLSASTGVIEAVIGRIPLEAKKATAITLRLEAPPESESELELREQIGGAGRRRQHLPTAISSVPDVPAHDPEKLHPVEGRSGVHRQCEKPSADRLEGQSY